MPIYEFVCNDCSAHFEKLTSFNWKSAGITCPQCSSEQLEQAVSCIGTIKGSAVKLSPGGSSSCGSCHSGSCSTCH